MLWKLMLFCVRHKALFRFYRCMVVVYKPRRKFVRDIKVGDILSVDGEFVTVCGDVYDDGIDDVIPVRYANGNIEALSPLMFDY